MLSIFALALLSLAAAESSAEHVALRPATDVPMTCIERVVGDQQPACTAERASVQLLEERIVALARMDTCSLAIPVDRRSWRDTSVRGALLLTVLALQELETRLQI